MSSGGAASVARYRQLLSSNSLTTSYDEVDADIDEQVSWLLFGNSSAESVVLAIGASASEVEIALLPPASHGFIPCIIPKGIRVAIKGAVTVSSGVISLDFRY